MKMIWERNHAEIYYYDKFQGYMAVEQDKLDACVYDKLQMELAVANGQKGVKVLDSVIGNRQRLSLVYLTVLIS